MQPKHFKFKKLFFVFCFSLLSTPFASLAIEPLPTSLVNLESEEGLALLQQELDLNALKLLSHFTTQNSPNYCGVASAVMVLNASNLAPPVDVACYPSHYFNQTNFFNDKVLEIVLPQDAERQGMTMRQLSQALTSHGLKAKPVFADNLTLETFRQSLKRALADQHFVIVNFSRPLLQQQGGGHHSPVAAYNEESDQFLILDVARFKYPSYWVATEDLWKAVSTKDVGAEESRGFVVIEQSVQRNN